MVTSSHLMGASFVGRPQADPWGAWNSPMPDANAAANEVTARYKNVPTSEIANAVISSI
jgi:hypothetical protein